jgi:hypothetical protein
VVDWRAGMKTDGIKTDTSDPALCLVSYILSYIFNYILEPDTNYSDIDIYFIYILEIQF